MVSHKISRPFYRSCTPHLLLLGAVLFLPCAAVRPASPATQPATAAATRPASHPFETEILRFEAKDELSEPISKPTLFVGSSSFTRWKSLETEFEAFRPINRGFGGSTFPDLIYYFDRIVLRYKPTRIVVYEGTNDIAIKRTPEQVAGDVKTLAALVKKNLPNTQLYILSLNAAPVRAELAGQMNQANALIQEFVKTDPHLHFVDLTKVLTDAQGKPDPQYYEADRLHPNDKGYARWIPVITAALKAP